MMITALVALSTVPNYHTLPPVDHRGIAQCRQSYDRLERFLGNYYHRVDEKTIQRGGRYTWDQARDAKVMGNMTAKPYLEEIRRIAPRGDGARCHALYRDGRMAIIVDVIAPLFGDPSKQ